MEKKIIAHVWAGGSILGGWEIGAAHSLIVKKGIIPDIITGVSVGSLNGLLYTNFLGKYIDPHRAIYECVQFWRDNVKQPSDIITKKGTFRVVMEAITKNFTGLLKTSELEQMVNESISLDSVALANVRINVGATNMNTGLVDNVQNGHPQIKEFTLASTRIPFMMPPSEINGYQYFDTGLIDNAAVGRAIEMGADEIHVIACQPERVTQGFKDSKNPMKLVGRVMEITVNNTLNDDIKAVERYNEFLAIQPGFKGKRHIEMTVYRPEKHIEIDIESFTEQDIFDMIEDGKNSV